MPRPNDPVEIFPGSPFWDAVRDAPEGDTIGELQERLKRDHPEYIERLRAELRDRPKT